MTTASIDRRELVLALRAVRAHSDGHLQAVEPRAFEAPLANATRLGDWAFAQGGLKRGAATRRPSTMRPVAATCLFFALLLGLQRAAPSASFPPSPLVSASSAARTGPLENRSMKFAKSLVVASSALLASGAALAQDAVQWRVEDGGNGHWYQFNPTAQAWSLAQSQAQGQGGHLACISSMEENDFVRGRLPIGQQAVGYLGGFRDRTGWRWVTGEPWIFQGWNPGEPNGDAGEVLWIANIPGYPNGWNDHPPTDPSNIQASIFEWSSDCNSDGLVDYGQIRAGELEDTNANNIPDCCEQAVPCDPCAADVDESGVVSGVDLAAVLGAWGTSGGKYPRADINGDGVVDGADLAAVLNGWGPCP
jgi:hypothetical protein